jgi:hypothetical protein
MNENSNKKEKKLMRMFSTKLIAEDPNEECKFRQRMRLDPVEEKMKNLEQGFNVYISGANKERVDNLRKKEEISKKLKNIQSKVQQEERRGWDKKKATQLFKRFQSAEGKNQTILNTNESYYSMIGKNIMNTMDFKVSQDSFYSIDKMVNTINFPKDLNKFLNSNDFSYNYNLNVTELLNNIGSTSINTTDLIEKYDQLYNNNNKDNNEISTNTNTDFPQRKRKTWTTPTYNNLINNPNINPENTTQNEIEVIPEEEGIINDEKELFDSHYSINTIPTKTTYSNIETNN